MSRFYRTAETLKLGSQTLPGRFFTSQAVFEAEIDRIYYSGWVYAGRTSQIDNAGDYFLFQCGGESVILLRDQSSEPRGFYNVCRHRGSRLCEAESGRFPHSIQCAYHAWTYGLDGQLIGAPLMDEVFEFRKEAHSLIPIAVADWEGFLFVNLAVQPEPFEDVFAPLAGKFNDWNLSQLENAGLIEYQVNANWKLIVQNYSECYHCPSIHPDLAKKSPYRSGKNDLFDGKFLGGYMDLAEGNGSLTLSGRACAPPLGSVNGEDLKRVYYYTIFPNMLLSLHPDYVMVHRLAPENTGHTRVTCEWLFAPDTFRRSDLSPSDAIDFWDRVNRQDWHVCELSQQGVASRAYKPAPYSGQESLLAAFDRQVLKALGNLEVKED